MNEKSDILEVASVDLGSPYKAILFNDNVHTQAEVASQIIKAIHCDAIRAVEIMMTPHKTGSTVVFAGTLERCEHVVSVIEKIKLLTKVESA